MPYLTLSLHAEKQAMSPSIRPLILANSGIRLDFGQDRLGQLEHTERTYMRREWRVCRRLDACVPNKQQTHTGSTARPE